MENPFANLTSECPACGGKEVSTGKTEMGDDNRIYFEFHCTECGSIGMEWSLERQQKLIDAFRS